MPITTAAQEILSRTGMDLNSVPEQYWELIEKYRDKLIAQAQALLGNREDAEDVVQETFCDALKRPEKLAQAESVSAWLHAINRNKALHRLRSRSQASKQSQRQKQRSHTTFTTGGFSGLELRDTIARALDILPAQMREVVRLRYWQHLSCKQIAAQLKLPEGSVRRILFEASNKMFDSLKLQLKPPEKPADTENLPEASNENER